MTLNIESYYAVSGVQYVIISSYWLHIGHNRSLRFSCYNYIVKWNTSGTTKWLQEMLISEGHYFTITTI